MNIAFFGGTFDPVHRGHIELARAAAERFRLDRVLFVPAHIQPLKQHQPTTEYYHRFAMLALATQEERAFVVSPLEAPGRDNGPSYSIHTIRELKRTLKKADKLYFLIGIDAFRGLHQWYKSAELLRECEFIIASRPGFSMGDIAEALPSDLRPKEDVLKIAKKQKLDFSSQSVRTVALSGVTLHLMEDISERVSSTQIRAAAESSGKARLQKLVGGAVAAYIVKTGIYRRAAAKRQTEKEGPESAAITKSSKRKGAVRASKSNQ